MDSDDNFISQDLARQSRIPVETLPDPKTIPGLDGAVLARITHQTQTMTLNVSVNHCKQISFFLIPASSSPGELGAPGLTGHSPQIDWSTRRLVSRSMACHTDCLRSAASPSSGRLYNLTRAEQEAMHSYMVRLDLALFLSSWGRVLLCSEEGWFVQPCIGYRALNEIMVRNNPLPLLDAASAPLHRAQVLSKLDLHNAHHLAQIREGDEWKTASNSPLGHSSTLSRLSD